MIVGVAQMRLSPDLGRNLESIKRFVAKAADEGVGILNFPETCLTGYIYDRFLKVKKEDVELRLNQLKEIVQKSGVSIIVGTPLWQNDKLFNSVVVLLYDGRQFLYHKINLVSYENDYFAAGHETLTFVLKGLTCATIICRDQNFPDLARKYKESGVQVLFISCAHFYPPNEARLKIDKNRALPIVRAYENEMFVCKSNAIGTIRGKINLGHSLIVAPNGCVVCEAGETTEELLSFEIDPTFDWKW